MAAGDKIFWITALAFFLLMNLAAGFKKTRHLSRIRAARRILRNINTIRNDSPGWLFSYLRKIDPFVFEELILLTFRKYGFRIRRNRRYTHDGGIDGRVWRRGERFLVQAKRYSGNINIEHVRSFIEVCRSYKARGYFIHTGRTGKEIKELARANPQIRILSGERVCEFFILSRFKDKDLFL